MYIYINTYICCKSKYISEIRDDPNVVPYVLPGKLSIVYMYLVQLQLHIQVQIHMQMRLHFFNRVVHNGKCICTYLHMYFYFNIM